MNNRVGKRRQKRQQSASSITETFIGWRVGMEIQFCLGQSLKKLSKKLYHKTSNLSSRHQASSPVFAGLLMHESLLTEHYVLRRTQAMLKILLALGHNR